MMDLKLRLAALSKLMDNKSEAVEHRLSEEFRRVEDLLGHGTDYDELWGALKILAVLAPRFHGAVLPLLVSFVHSIPSRPLTHGGEPIPASRLRYRSAGHLIREAIDVANPVRYLYIEIVVDFLLELSRTDEEEVRGKAVRALEALAKFDLDIFYGDRGLGAQPQARIVTHLAKLNTNQLVANAGVIFGVLRNVLSPSMEGHSWTYSSLTISRSAITNGAGIAEMRADAIALLKRMYPLNEAIRYRKNVLNTLDSAIRRERPVVDADTALMFERDALIVLDFLRGLVATETLPLVQTIEHQAYWDYYHAASPAIESAALAVRDALATHTEYQIYKQLIGFEGIFGEWEELRRSESAWDYTDAKRHAAARQYLEEINAATYEQWRDRILEFSETRSDDLATFPVYYEFLESIGRERPRLALELVTAHTEVMSPFLIALLRGLWASAQSADIESIVDRWIADGVHLMEIAKSLYKVGSSRLDTLYSVIARSTTLDDRDPILHVMGVAASLYAEGSEPAKAIFMQGLRELAKHDDARWANVVWFSRDFRSLVGAMTPSERAEVLASLATLPELGYQAEEILFAIAEQDVQSVLDYLVGRLKRARERPTQNHDAGSDADALEDTKFEAVPYDLHKLDKQLAKVPAALLWALRRDFDEEAHGLFTYRGARLIKAAFPEFGEPLDGLLLKFVKGGREEDIAFVLGVLRVYEGSAVILDVCKAIIKVIPERSKLWNEVAACIESTGVVSGEYGMVDAFERKRSEIAAWQYDDDPRVQAFAQWLTESLVRLIDSERQRADEDLALRKYKFGEGKNEV